MDDRPLMVSHLWFSEVWMAPCLIAERLSGWREPFLKYVLHYTDGYVKHDTKDRIKIRNVGRKIH